MPQSFFRLLVLIFLLWGMFVGPVTATPPSLDQDQLLRVGLFYREKVNRAMVVIERGAYEVWAGNKLLCFLDAKDGLYLTSSPGGIQVSTLNSNLGTYPALRIKGKLEGRHFRLRTLSPRQKEELYPDDLNVGQSPYGLKLINQTGLEQYVAGVVEAETGKGHLEEFYKVQAIICRTYVLRQRGKFERDGFDVCDKVECQVYHGMARHEPAIHKAVRATRGLVLVDDNAQLITAVFHSNSGGETVSSEAVWGKALPYLRSRQDPYSFDMPHSYWQVTIPTNDWLSYLEDKYQFPVADSVAREHVLGFCPQKRRLDLGKGPQPPPLKQIRKDWGLKSTHFTVEARGDSVLLQGQGFGHGVGLSQEGAMAMSLQGIDFQKIIHFYYRNVALVHREMLPFFQAP